MKDRSWFFKYLKRALLERKGRSAVAALSVTVATAVLVSTLGLSLSTRKQLGGALSAYGANIIVSPGGPIGGSERGGAPSETGPTGGSGPIGGSDIWLDEEAAASVAALPGVHEITGQLYLRADLGGGATVELIGMDVQKLKGAKLTGAAPRTGEALLGVKLKDALAVKTGSTLEVEINGAKSALAVSGFIETGGAEDGSIIIALRDAQRLAGLEGKLSAMLVRGSTGGPGRGLSDVVREIKTALPGAGVRTIREVAAAEEGFLKKMGLLMALVSAVVVLSSVVSVSSTMGATVLERMREIGLMKALGGTRREIGLFYLAEAAAIGLAGGAVGYPVGYMAAQAVSQGAFGSFVTVPLYIGLFSIAVGVALSVAASAAPLMAALRREPSRVLRGQ